MGNPQRDAKYRVALSYAGEDRPYVKRVYDYLAAHRVSTFYDQANPALLWGQHLTEELNRIYEKDSASVVIFASKDYAAKDWTRYERRSALSKAAHSPGVYVLLAKFDDTELPGVTGDVVYLSLSDYTPEEFAALLVKRLTQLGIIPPI
jgi:hypothetical protein